MMTLASSVCAGVKTCLAVLFIVACNHAAPAVTVAAPSPSATVDTAITEDRPVSKCPLASRHDIDAVMRAEGLELCSRDAVVRGEGPDGNSEAGFVSLVHGELVLHEESVGGGDAKGYGWSGSSKLLGAKATTIAGRRVVTIRWEQRTAGWSTGMGGSVAIVDVVTAVCTIEAVVKCPFIRQTERDITVTGGPQDTHEREAWTVSISPDGILTATLVKRFTDDGEQPPVRVPLF
jgi:hypothetical protein